MQGPPGGRCQCGRLLSQPCLWLPGAWQQALSGMQVRGRLGATQDWALSFSGVSKGDSKAPIMTIARGFSVSPLLTFGAKKFFVVGA